MINNLNKNIISSIPENADFQSDTLEVGLYLLPVALSDGDPAYSLPAYNLEICRKIKHFIVENKRTARRFLKKIDKSINIDGLTMVELDEHTSPADIPPMLAPIEAGQAVGLMSEAGCPAVADPGALLVAAAQRRGITVVPLVGPSSILLALMASGFNGQNFTFNGYLPIDDRQRDNALRNMAGAVARHNVTQIFIETPYRNNRLIARMTAVLPGDCLLCVASDLTGPRQSVRTMPLAQWKKADYNYDKIPTIFVLGK